MSFWRKLSISVLAFAGGSLFLCTVLVVWQIDSSDTFFRDRLVVSKQSEFTVKAGEGITQLLKRMTREDIITAKPPYALSIHLKLRDLDVSIKRGVYTISPDLSVEDALRLFAEGKTIQRRWSLIEGLTILEFLPSLKKAKGIHYDLPQVNNRSDYAALSEFLDIPHNNPEGLFLSDTYFYDNGATASSILKRAHYALQKALDANDVTCDALEKKIPIRLTQDERAVFASIIEKETGVAKERPLIAAVFYNRLQRKMRLQTDPTVIYGLADRYNGNITRRHLREATPWNTYVIAGLPPTPISSFGQAALDAVCSPDEQAMKHNPLLFFVGKGDGTHYFSSTLREHNQAVKRYQLRPNADYRSSPSANVLTN